MQVSSVYILHESFRCSFDMINHLFLFIKVGLVRSPLYSLFLGFFYICSIKYSIAPGQFRKKFEVYIHVVLTAFIWSSAIFLAITKNFNSIGISCWIGPYPMDCIEEDSIDCIYGLVDNFSF